MACPRRRGVFDHVDVELRCAAPLGLMWWRRRRRVPLARPLKVGPAPIPTPIPSPAAVATAPGNSVRPWNAGETVRGVREYAVGDRAGLIHWAATARRRQTMVKELERTERAGLVIVVDLRGPPEEAEAAAGRAAGLADAAVAEGVPVVLATTEREGPRIAPVASPSDTASRLARAVAGPPPEPSESSGATVVRIGVR